MVDMSWSIRDMKIQGKRTVLRWGVVLSLLLTVASASISGANVPSISIGFSLDLPQMSGLTGTVTARWVGSEIRLGFFHSAGQALPHLSFESTLRRGRVDLRGRVEGILVSPFFAAGLGVRGDQAKVHFEARFELSAGRLSLDTQHLELMLSPLVGTQMGGRLGFSDAGVFLSAFDASAQTGWVDVAYHAAWDEARNASSTYSVEIPSLRLGLAGSIRTTEAGREVTTSWFPVLPPGFEHVVAYEDPSASIRPAVALQEGRTSQLQDSDCTVCGSTATRADSSEDTVDFGEVMVGDVSQSRITLNCQMHAFCWLDEVSVWPRLPFTITNAPIRLVIPLGGRRDIELRFAPSGVGRFEQTIALRYCFATWHEHEEVFEGVALDAVEGHYTYRCMTVTIPLIGVALAKPEARATYSPDRPVCGRDVQFNGSSSFDPNPEGAITAYEWDFGDGSTAVGMSPVHRFSRSGTYSVRLTVWNNREMTSDPYVLEVEVSPDLIEAAGVTGAAVAAGLATYTVGLAPPLLLAAVPGAALAFASIVHELGSARFPIDQLILRFPQSWDEADVQQLVERNVPGARVIGYFSSLHTFLIRLPIETNSASQAAAELDVVRERLAKVLPYGAQLGRNYLGAFEGQLQSMASGELCDMESLAADLRVAYEAIRAPEAWRRMAEADVLLKPVRIAVIDSGIDADHAEFVIPLRGRSYIKEADGALQPWYEDSGGHGTQISGIIGAENGGGRMNGILAGSAGHYEMQVYRVIGDMFSVWDCLRIAVSKTVDQLDVWAEAAEAASRRKSVVLNISMGWDLDTFPDDERMLSRNTFLDLFASYPEALFVTSAGNGDAPGDLSLSTGKQIVIGGNLHAPGGVAAPNNLTVAATNPTGTELTPWSNYGSAVDIAAPGEDVYTTDNDGSYVWRVEGTSYAAAMVSGAAAAILSIDPKLTPAEVKDILMSSPTRVSAPDGASIPVLDFADAVRRAVESRQERSRNTLWWSAGLGLGALVLGFLILRPI